MILFKISKKESLNSQWMGKYIFKVSVKNTSLIS